MENPKSKNWNFVFTDYSECERDAMSKSLKTLCNYFITAEDKNDYIGYIQMKDTHTVKSLENMFPNVTWTRSEMSAERSRHHMQEFTCNCEYGKIVIRGDARPNAGQKRKLQEDKSTQTVPEEEPEEVPKSKINGTIPKQVQSIREEFLQSKLRPWQQELLNKLEKELPVQFTYKLPIIHWYWEPKGNTGKTWMTKYLKFKLQAWLLYPYWHIDVLRRVYKGQKLLTMDYFRCMERVNYKLINELCAGDLYSDYYFVDEDEQPHETTLPIMVIFSQREPDRSKLEDHIILDEHLITKDEL